MFNVDIHTCAYGVNSRSVVWQTAAQNRKKDSANSWRLGYKFLNDSYYRSEPKASIKYYKEAHLSSTIQKFNQLVEPWLALYCAVVLRSLFSEVYTLQKQAHESTTHSHDCKYKLILQKCRKHSSGYTIHFTTYYR